jgi:hypothetical protein
MATIAIFEKLNSEERRRYIAEHAPGILRALIMRRSSTDPHRLVDLAIETCSALFDAVAPGRREQPQNGQIVDRQEIRLN